MLLTVYDEVFGIIGESLEKGIVSQELVGRPIEPIFRVR
jgi:hypothetical protein